MKASSRHLCILYALFFALPVSAGHLQEVHLLPVAGHTAGAGQTFWRTDLAVFNPNTTPITLEILFVEAGEGRLDNVSTLGARQGESLSVPPRSSLRLSDLLGDRDGLQDVTGALIVGAEQRFTITSRSFTTADSGGTFGQTVPAASEFVHQPGETLLLPALSSSVGARSNVGLVASADDSTALVLEVRLLSEDGTLLGSRTVTVPAGGINQLQVSTAEIDATSFDSGAAEIMIISGSGAVSGYASVIDNITGDAVFVEAAALRTTSAGLLSDATERLTRFFHQEKER